MSLPRIVVRGFGDKEYTFHGFPNDRTIDAVKVVRSGFITYARSKTGKLYSGHCRSGVRYINGISNPNYVEMLWRLGVITKKAWLQHQAKAAALVTRCACGSSVSPSLEVARV